MSVTASVTSGAKFFKTSTNIYSRTVPKDSAARLNTKVNLLTDRVIYLQVYCSEMIEMMSSMC